MPREAEAKTTRYRASSRARARRSVHEFRDGARRRFCGHCALARRASALVLAVAFAEYVIDLFRYACLQRSVKRLAKNVEKRVGLFPAFILRDKIFGDRQGKQDQRKEPAAASPA